MIMTADIGAVFFYWKYSVSYSDNTINKNYDCGVVFFHSVKKSGGLSEETQRRCDVSAGLFFEEKINYIICSGGARTNSILMGSKLMKEYLKQLNVPDSLIFTDTISYSTKTNIIESDRIIGINNFKSAVLISSPSHMIRIRHLSEGYSFEKEYLTYKSNYNLFEIFADCNTEFIKWVYLLFLPDNFTDYSKELLSCVKLNQKRG